MNSKANDQQVGGEHYLKQTYQHWDFVLKTNLPYMEAQIVKYLSRWRAKNGVQDLHKALHFIDKLIEWYAGNTGQFMAECVDRYEVLSYLGINQIPTVESRVIMLIAWCSGLADLQTAHVALQELINLETACEPGPGYVDQDRGELAARRVQR